MCGGGVEGLMGTGAAGMNKSWQASPLIKYVCVCVCLWTHLCVCVHLEAVVLILVKTQFNQSADGSSTES